MPPGRSPRVERLRTMQEPSPDAIAQILLEEMIVSDPQWIEECAPARAKMWELAQASPKARAQLSHALRQAGFNPDCFGIPLQQPPAELTKERMTMPLSAQHYELLETLEKTASSDFWTTQMTLQEVASAAHG